MISGPAAQQHQQAIADALNTPQQTVGQWLTKKRQLSETGKAPGATTTSRASRESRPSGPQLTQAAGAWVERQADWAWVLGGAKERPNRPALRGDSLDRPQGPVQEIAPGAAQIEAELILCTTSRAWRGRCAIT